MPCSLNGLPRTDLPTVNANFVVAGYGNEIWSSVDGKNWTESCRLLNYSDDDNSNLRGVTFGNGLFVAAGGGTVMNGVGIVGPKTTRILVSYDGYRWEERGPASGDQWLGGVAFGNGVFVAGGGCGIIARSSDGFNWNTAYPIGGDCPSIRSMYFSGGNFYGVGDKGNYQSADNGVTWSNGTGPGAPSSGANRVTVGDGNMVRASTNGGDSYNETKVGANFMNGGAARN
jgi:hypothetical protein